MPARGRWRCYGCSITPTASTPCWTSLSALACRSSTCAKPRMPCWRIGSWLTVLRRLPAQRYQADGHIAVVTGAGSGVGQGIALALAAQGATLCLVGRTLATLEATASDATHAKV